MAKKPEPKPRGKRGHYKAGEEKQKAIILSLSEGSTVVSACAAANTPRSMFYEWYKNDATFKDLVDKACKSRVHHVVDSLFKKAIEGNLTAIIFFLCNRDPENWKNVNKVEAELHGQGPIHFVLYDPDKHTKPGEPGKAA